MSDTTFSWGAIDATLESEAERALAPFVPATVAGRYELDSLLGEGGGGQVYLATDRVTGDDVAVKLMPALSVVARDRVLREVTALRWLRLPGVVRLRDDGQEGPHYFFVMDRVAGRPFPGLRGPHAWEALSAPALALLEILARVHQAGVVHRDLKPANVLVDDDQRPVVLDFGIASGGALSLDGGAAAAAGTPAYLAPEQLVRGEVDGRADLYAVGVMLYEALVGSNPFSGGSASDVLRRKVLYAPPPLAVWEPDAPAAVIALVDRMIARDPADRPESALAVLEVLRGGGGVLEDALAGRLSADRPARLEELADLFVGPDVFLHLREDAARALYARTGGDPKAVSDELGAWTRAGLASWDGGLFTVRRPALAQLDAGLVAGVSAPAPPLPPDEARVLQWARLAWPDATHALLMRVTGASDAGVAVALDALRASGLVWALPGDRVGTRPGSSGDPEGGAGLAAAHRLLAEAHPRPSEARLRHLLAAGVGLDRLLPEIRALAEALLHAGQLARALSVAELGLPLARRYGGEDEDALLRILCLAALAEEAEAPLDRALADLGRAEGGSLLREALLDLVQGFRAALRGEGPRALRLLDLLPPFEDEALEIWRQGARWRAAMSAGVGAEKALLQGLEDWAQGGPERAARYAGWNANLAYREGRFAESAALHARAAAARGSGWGHLWSSLNAASALLEGLAFEAAEGLATEVLREAAALRMPMAEALAAFCVRSIGYRTGRAMTPAVELVDAAGAVGPYPEGLFALNEAAVAYRAGSSEAAVGLARRARDAFARVGIREGELLAAALAIAAGGDRRGEASVLAREAMQLRAHDHAVQILGLLGRAVPSPDPSWRAAAIERAASRPTSEWAVRLDVLSFEEAIWAGDVRPSQEPG